MCLAQDNKREAGTAAGFGSEIHSTPNGREGINEPKWEICIYLCLKTADKLLRKN